MKLFPAKALAACCAASLLLSGCIDKDYDLSDIDTTSEFKVVNLTIPVNIDPVEMNSIMDLEDDGIVKVVNGQYCVVMENSFRSNPVHIDKVDLKCDPIDSSSKTFDLSGHGGTFPADLPSIDLDLSGNPSNFDIQTSEVPECITGITEVESDMRVTVTLELKGLGSNLKGFQLKDAVLSLPKGLKDVSGPGTYDEETGQFKVTDTRVTGSSVNLVVKVGCINFKDSGANFNPDSHSIQFKGHISLSNAIAVITPSDLADNAKLASTVTSETHYNIDKIEVKSFTGNLNYKIEGLDIPDVELNDLPDVLTQSGTNISLVNPQIYMHLNNPVAAYDVEAKVGLDIKSLREGKVDGDYPLGSDIVLLPQNDLRYCLSPLAVNPYPEGWGNSTHITYARLGEILSGDGLPDALEIHAVNPRIDSPVTKFKIGQDISPVEGDYYLLAPLALADGSQIYYTGDIDGWYDSDMDKVLVNKLSVTAEITSDIPVSINFTGYPIDVNGDRIIDAETGKPVSIAGGDVPANAKNHPLTLEITGAIRGLDGIRYFATAKSDENGAALSENMTITISNVRATVSGSYTTDF